MAFLTTDNREHYKKYSETFPFFGSAPEALLEGLKDFPQEVDLHVVSCLQRQITVTSADLAENIHYRGLFVPKWGWMRTGYQGCFRAVRRELREIQPDIVHGQGTERDCAVSAVMSGFPNVLTIHGNMQSIARQIRAKPLSYYWLAARLERFCLAKTNGVVAISTYTKRNVESRNKQVWLAQNAVNPVFFGIERRESHIPRLLCVAHISRWKNQIGLIKAVEPLRKEYAFDLVFAGKADSTDPYAAKFLRMVAERPWCVHTGGLSRDGLIEEMAAARAVILPSLEDNCPMAILEASAAGLPIAASSVGGIPDLIEHGRDGVLFSPLDPDSTASAVRLLLSDPATAEKLASRAREKCLRKNSPRAVAERHLEIYREIVGLIHGTRRG